MDVLSSGRLTYGKWSREFERRWAAMHHRKFAVFVNSGTDALRIGLAAMKEKYGWKAGDEVLVPALTFVSSVNAILQNNLWPVLVDVEPDYYSMASVAIARPMAVMPVHLFGQASPRHGSLPSIVDSCETVGVPGCAEGDVSCFSTYACHLINTGVGGMATTNDPDLAALLRSYANHGRSGVYTGIDDALGQYEVIDARFKFERVGYSSRATEMEAAIGCAALDEWDENLRRRRQNAEALFAALSDLPLALPKVRPGAEHSWMMYPIRAENRAIRDRLVQHLEANGIETRYLLPLTNQPYIKAIFGDIEDEYPVAKMCNETGFYIGCHQHLDAGDIAYVAEVFHESYGGSNG